MRRRTTGRTSLLATLALVAAWPGAAGAQERWDYAAHEHCTTDVASSCATSATFDGRAMRAAVALDTGADGQAPASEDLAAGAGVGGSEVLDVPAGESTYTAEVEVAEAAAASTARTGHARSEVLAWLWVAEPGGWGRSVRAEIPLEPGRHTVSLRFAMPQAGRVQVGASIFATASVGSRFSELEVRFASICQPLPSPPVIRPVPPIFPPFLCVPYPTGARPPGDAPVG